jgi:5-methylcytosine-specific restriction endonuclease McrA
LYYKSKRSRECDIPPKVKAKVWERDGCRCILCGAPGAPNSHYIKRSAGGLGIPQNIVTMCARCHEAYDSVAHARLEPLVRTYLKSKYTGWSPYKLIYRRNKNNGKL